MKRCPTCQKEFADSMRFCQTDGTPLVAAEEKPAAPPPPPPDPYKTIVGGAFKMDEDLLQIPEQQDPNKTMVSPVNIPRSEPPKVDPAPLPSSPPKPTNESVSNVPPKPANNPFDMPPPAPKFDDAGLKAPNFSDLPPASSGNPAPPSAPVKKDPPKIETPPKPFDAPKFDQPSAPKNNSPFGNSPFASDMGDKGSSPFDKPNSAPSSSPFDKPSPFDKSPSPPFKEPETVFNSQPPAYNQSPFSQPPQTPFGQPNNAFNQPVQDEWAPPAPPVAGWQDQGLGVNTPFQPPASGTGQNQTLAIVSLISGIVGLLFCMGATSPIALVTGFMARKKAAQNPAEYGGAGLALAGIITGAVGSLLLVFVALYFILVFGILFTSNF
jgi:hypothetical protein